MFAVSLISWYKKNYRKLPWRNTNEPYTIWVSEIILQQTRVDQGLPYFKNFIERFPTLESLAKSSEEEVLNQWQGLGYYSRARNMHYTAKYIFNHLNGTFPNKYKELIKLKGIGDYTASAIASFSFNEPKAVIDGNVYRVLSRVFGILNDINSKEGQNGIKNLADNLLPKKEHATYNQAIMEFGALICAPKVPKCETCVIANICYAKEKGEQLSLPLKIKKVKIKTRYFNFLVFQLNDYIVIEKRTDKDIWQHLYQFPMIETSEEIEDPLNLKKLKGNIINLKKVKHLLTHQVIMASFWHMSVQTLPEKKCYLKIPLSQLHKYPVPKIVENYAKEYLTIN
tara:strand:+ start:452 stop:1471 length:1020 start_codon:yes stop_codon:yes gene_type:complete